MDIRAVNLNFTETLRYVPGVVADQFGFSGQGFEYMGMRGFNVQTTANFRDNLISGDRALFRRFLLPTPMP